MLCATRKTAACAVSGLGESAIPMLLGVRRAAAFGFKVSELVTVSLPSFRTIGYLLFHSTGVFPYQSWLGMVKKIHNNIIEILFPWLSLWGWEIACADFEL